MTWGDASGIEGNYGEDDPEDLEAETEPPSKKSSSEPTAKQNTSNTSESTARGDNIDTSDTQTVSSKCGAETRSGTPCTNNAVTEGYCNHHAPNAAGELTWKFERQQMYMMPEDAKELSKLRKRMELDLDVELSKKEFERSVAQLLLDDETVQQQLAKLLEQKYIDSE